MITALDHVAIVVKDLVAAEARYAALLGCAPNWRGLDHGAANVWFQLDNTAVDLISPVGDGPGGDRFRAVLETRGEGAWALAFATPDLSGAHKLMERRGVAVTPTHALRSTHPESGEKRMWQMFSTELAGVTTFVMEQRPDAAPWPRGEMTSASGVTGLDHAVVRTPAPERAQAIYGARLGLDMRLDRTAPEWGTRLMFFRCGDLIVEIAHDLKAGVSDGPDALWGFTWRTADVDGAQKRLKGDGFNVSDIRPGRRPGTRVFTVRDGTGNVPTLFIGP